MDDVPNIIASCLYTGIYDRLTFVKKQLPYSDFDYIEKSYNELSEAVDWYNKNCIISGRYLTEALDGLKRAYYDCAIRNGK